jgi:4-diphosphocytidyl-2-C-methyl-D-erythritol kinase
LSDLIFIKKIKGPDHRISFYGNFSKNIDSDNTVVKLFKILDKKKLLKDRKFKIRIKKNIPQKAGLGGGSMNASSVLNFLIEKKIVKISQKQIQNISSLIGSDVILGINHSSAILKSNNVVKKFSKCSIFHTLLVKPNFGCSTKVIYSRVKKITNSKFNNPKKLMFNPEYLARQENALEVAAFSRYPKLKRIKSFLENLKNPLFVRMTGSGSVIIAYYQSKKDCELAKVQFKRKYKNYWCNTSKTI